MMTAAIMTPIWSTMPTAVITESSEKTMSRMAIWPMMPQNSAPRPAAAETPGVASGACWSRASTSMKISCEAL